MTEAAGMNSALAAPRAAMLVAVLSLASEAALASEPKAFQDVSIVSPSDGARVSGRHVLSVVVPESVELSDVSWRYRSGTGRWAVIQTPLAALDERSILGVWDVSALQPGRAQLQVRVQVFPGIWVERTVRVHVERTGDLKGTLVPAQQRPPEQQIKAAFCGVTRMDVVTNGNSQVAVEGGAQPRPIRLGPRDTVPATLEGTPTNRRYDYFFAFDVVADLEPGSTPALCPERQVYQGIRRLDNRVETPRGTRIDPDTWVERGEGECHLDSRDWCLDPPYSGPGTGDLTDGTTTPVKVHRNDKIMWFDGNGFATVQGTGISGGLIWNSRRNILKLDLDGHVIPDASGQPERYPTGNWAETKFRAMVRGTEGRGSWQCMFTVRFHVQSQPDATVTKPQPPILENEMCAPAPI